ncbi:related to zinc finger protein [Rhynchosporium graminicola]|uniref:Related to zinc finger protein n=1 Tax=Rhynchosporium graminicola TaxID=2792576 RepID=A0A1E1L715_9HELO|nr:related to zinc finger protein [Rhynchosporium commune]
MSIPNVREIAPPPLPPPRYLADLADRGHNEPDIAWKWGNSPKDGAWGDSTSQVAPGSSLHGSNGRFLGWGGKSNENIDAQRRGNSTSAVKSEVRNSPYQKDEGYESLGASVWSIKTKPQESASSFASFQSTVHDSYQIPAQSFDKYQLQKLDSRRGSSDNVVSSRSHSKPSHGTFFNDASPTSRLHEHRSPGSLKPLSLPILPGRPGLAESPLSRWADTPLPSAVSPRNPYPRFGMHTDYDETSPIEASDSNRSPLPYIRRTGSNSMITHDDDSSSVCSRPRESYDHRGTPEHDDDFLMEDSGFRRPHTDDYPNRPEMSTAGGIAGQKRRASSPPGDEGPTLHTVGSAGDLYRRREAALRASPSPRFHSTSGSISSTTSGPRNNSYASTLSVNASSITSLGSHGRLSPGGISPGGFSNAGSDMSDSPYVSSLSLNASPGQSRVSHSRGPSADAHLLMMARQLYESIGASKQTPSKVHGILMCECCPKKPKKFDTAEELSAHEQEKQYECAYCNNRFKNKNEAERHQNSLHLRRHSWSCAALSGYSAAFHNSLNRPNEADTCGYCGEDFPRTGISSTPGTLGSDAHAGHPIAIATREDWDARIAHLQEMHKFGECNQAKKFFRADHFRQHLKHSHAGTSGKWTNMLEAACMGEEPLPEARRAPGRLAGIITGGARVERITEEEQSFQTHPAGVNQGGARVGMMREQGEMLDMDRRRNRQPLPPVPPFPAVNGEINNSETKDRQKE